MQSRPHRHLHFPHIALLIAWLFAGMASVHAANDRGLVFRAHNGAAELHLLGSIHLGNADMYPLRPAIQSAFDQADALIVELNINTVDPVRMAAWMNSLGQYPEGETLRDHVQPQTWQRLQAHLQKLGIAPESMQRYRPGILINMLTMMQLMQGGLSTELGLDQHFLAAAQAGNKPIIELETAEEQLAILASMPNADALINDTLDELENLDEASTTLFAAWKTGNGKALEREVNKAFQHDDAASREFFAKIFTRRNYAMAQRIALASKAHKKLFVVVGAGHLLGDEGVVTLLQKQGYRIEQL